MRSPKRLRTVLDELYTKENSRAKVQRMHEVQSSQIHKLGYDPETRYLAVQFQNLVTYGYGGVAPEVYCRLLNAESIGKYFTKNIKTEYGHKKLYDPSGSNPLFNTTTTVPKKVGE